MRILTIKNYIIFVKNDVGAIESEEEEELRSPKRLTKM